MREPTIEMAEAAAGMAIELKTDTIDSEIGPIVIVTDARALCALDFGDCEERMKELLTRRFEGTPYELTLALGVTANRFRRGHRIRVHVSSSFFPHLDRNPNTGSPVASAARLVPARQTVFLDRRRPSRAILPVAPA